MDTQSVLQMHRDEILRSAARYDASPVHIFGLTARGEARPVSDVDLRVDIEPGRGLLDLGGLVHDVQMLLGVDV